MLIHSVLFAQELNQQKAPVVDYNFFENEAPLHCTLSFNIREFINEKIEEKDIPAVFSYKKNDSTLVSEEIQIKSRGNSRKEICYFPPIKLKLKNASFDDPYLDQVKNQKLVTHCKTSKNYEQYLLKEHLVYRLFNLFTDMSLRVQLIKMDYIDTEQKVKTISRYAFLIEDVGLMSARNDCIEIENENLSMRHVDKSSMIQYSLFQFMIGNVDWKMDGLHNIKLLKSNDFTKEMPFIVPYDFDHSGFVDASYAVNVRNPEITSVKTRVFAGLCFTEQEYLDGLQKFIHLKPEIYETINSFQPLTAKSKKQSIAYLDKFYKMIEQPDFYKKYISNKCTAMDNGAE